LDVVGLTSDGLLHTISAAFTSSTCSASIDYLSPVPCAIIDEDLDGFANTNDCNDNNASVYPGAIEICDDLDNNCEGSVDEGLAFNTYYMDMDGDGFGTDAVDLCYDPASPLFCEFTFNLSDDFGDGWNFGYLDVLNGVTGAVVQTIGEEFTTGTAAAETALLSNGMSYNLFWTNGGGYPDEMGFDLLDPSGNILTSLTYFSAAQVGLTLYSLTVSCPAETMYVQINGDCDDANVAAYPGAEEICDIIDNNCDNTVDEGFDSDNDGYASCGGDCDDTNASINPAAPEVCGDAVDNNCNG
jgi:hypothetical protein